MNGLYIYNSETGERKLIGEIAETSITPTEEDGERITFTNEPITMRIELTRKDKRFWLRKVFSVPKYEVTEILFPRKKKRGTMRRRRHKE